MHACVDITRNFNSEALHVCDIDDEITWQHFQGIEASKSEFLYSWKRTD